MSWSRVSRTLKKLREQNPTQAYRYVGERLRSIWKGFFKNPSKPESAVTSHRPGANHSLGSGELCSKALYVGKVAIFRADTKLFAEISGWRTVPPDRLRFMMFQAHTWVVFGIDVEELVGRLAASMEKARQHERISSSRNPAVNSASTFSLLLRR